MEIKYKLTMLNPIKYEQKLKRWGLKRMEFLLEAAEVYIHRRERKEIGLPCCAREEVRDSMEVGLAKSLAVIRTGKKRMHQRARTA